jgi:competence protein ComEC
MDAVGTPANGNSPTADAPAPAEDGAQTRARYQPLVLVLLAVAAGMVLDRFGLPQIVGGAWWCLCAGCLAVWWLAWQQQRNAAAAWLLLVSTSLAGAAWHHWSWHEYDQWEISRYAALNPAPACITAIACESPERMSAPPPTPLRAIPTSERSRLVVEVTGIRDGREWRPASGLCQLALNGHLLGIHPGDSLQVFGQLARQAPPLNPGEFDFAANSRAERQLARIRSTAPECIVRGAAGSSWTPSYWLDRLRARTKQLVHDMVGPQRAGLAAAILLGAREGLPYEETEPYLQTGTIHVSAV